MLDLADKVFEKQQSYHSVKLFHRFSGSKYIQSFAKVAVHETVSAHFGLLRSGLGL